MRKLETLPLDNKISYDKAVPVDKSFAEGDYQLPHPQIKGYYFFVNLETTEDFEHLRFVLVKVVAKDGKTKMVTRSATYEELTMLKMFFFKIDEIILMYLPPNMDYENNHQFEGHLYRYKHAIPIPDGILSALSAGKGSIKEKE